MTPDPHHLHSLSILVIEGDPGETGLIQEYLVMAGCRSDALHSCRTISAALHYLETSDPDVALLGLNLPDGAGLAALFSLQTHCPELPVVTLTDVRDDHIALEAVKTGAQDYLIKGPSVQFALARSIQYAIERQQLLSFQHELALRDPLTDLYNRRGFMLLTEQQSRVAERRDSDLVLIYLDLDDLKSINDRFGHAAGDDALRDTARILRLTFRASDVAARLGGDEFAVLAIDAGQASVATLIDRLEGTLARYVARINRPYCLSFTVGETVKTPDRDAEIEALIESADEAMYLVKNSAQLVSSCGLPGAGRRLIGP